MTLREVREALGWTQQQLEAKSGVKQQVISDLEQRTTPEQYANVSYATITQLIATFQRHGLKGIKAEMLFPISIEKAS